MRTVEEAWLEYYEDCLAGNVIDEFTMAMLKGTFIAGGISEHSRLNHLDRELGLSNPNRERNARVIEMVYDLEETSNRVVADLEKMGL